MSRRAIFTLFFAAVFLQAGAYGLTFMLPQLFAGFGADEKDVGAMLTITAAATMLAVMFSGHISDRLGRMATLGWACLMIALALGLFGIASGLGLVLSLASAALGAGWGLTYALPPVVLSRLVTTETRVQMFALLSVFVMAGFGLSPVMAAILIERGADVRDAFFVMTGLCAVSAGLFFALSGPVRKLTEHLPREMASRLTLSNVRAVFATKAWRPLVMVFLGASVFAGVTNFQTVMAEARGLNYASYFLTYTITVILFRIAMARFSVGARPYLTIAGLQYVMCGSVLLFLVLGNSAPLYLLFAVLFGIGYGASYPILVAMAANDADEALMAQTLQLFALTYFVGIFGFPLVAGWLLVERGEVALLILVAGLAALEASLALMRGLNAHRL